MLQSIIFSGKKDSYSYEGTICMSADAQFNRWLFDHQSVVIKAIDRKFDKKVETIFVLYDVQDDFIEHPTTFEDGNYFINVDTGKFIECKRNIDVSYMIFNIQLIKSDLCIIDPCVVTAKNGYIYRSFSSFEKVPASHRPITINKKYSLKVKTEYVINKKYIPSPKIILKDSIFKFSENNGEYILNMSEKKLIKKDNNLDVSSLVNSFYDFGSGILKQVDPRTDICIIYDNGKFKVNNGDGYVDIVDAKEVIYPHTFI